MTHMRTTRRTLACAAVLLLTGLPAQALAQTAPAGPQTSAQPPAKMQVVAQTPAPAKVQVVVQTPAPAKVQVAVQTPGSSAPAAKPVAQPVPKLTFTAPPAARLGDTLRLQVVLVDPADKPISGAAVDFSSTQKFLNTDGSVVFAQAVTDAQGIASVDWQPRSDGNLTLTASFAGDKRFTGANAAAAVEVSGDRQLYAQQAGVSMPGLNTAPPMSMMAGLTPSLSPWPRLSGWPLVVVLLIVWSLYARAVSLMFTIARRREPGSPIEVR